MMVTALPAAGFVLPDVTVYLAGTAGTLVMFGLVPVRLEVSVAVTV
jgi:hypothetical protein